MKKQNLLKKALKFSAISLSMLLCSASAFSQSRSGCEYLNGNISSTRIFTEFGKVPNSIEITTTSILKTGANPSGHQGINAVITGFSKYKAEQTTTTSGSVRWMSHSTSSSAPYGSWTKHHAVSDLSSYLNTYAMRVFNYDGTYRDMEVNHVRPESIYFYTNTGDSTAGSTDNINAHVCWTVK